MTKRFSPSIRCGAGLFACLLLMAEPDVTSLTALLNCPGPVVLQFIFATCTTVCPVMTATLAAAQDQLSPARMISITIDPENDTPAVLQEYAHKFNAGPRWYFLPELRT